MHSCGVAFYQTTVDKSARNLIFTNFAACCDKTSDDASTDEYFVINKVFHTSAQTQTHAA